MNDGNKLDIVALLSPIAEHSTTGVDLRDDTSPQSLYFRLKDARASARAAERRADGEGGDPGLSPEWRTVFDLARQALATQSKDLEIACWLLEALVRIDGFAGLRDGLALIRGFVETYWESLHSLRDEEGTVTFVAPLAGLNGGDREGSLIQPIRKVPLTAAPELQPFAAYHYEQALALGEITDKAARERRIAAGAPTLEKFDQALRATPKAFLRKLLADLQAARGELATLSERLSEKCGADAPALSAIRNALEAVHDLVRSRTADFLPPEPVATAVAEPTAAPRVNGARPPTAAPSAAVIGDREDALLVLAKVSEFFRRTEPHSPIAFALDDLVRRARMPLPELLAELLPDSNARRTFLTTAGIRPPPESGAEGKQSK